MSTEKQSGYSAGPWTADDTATVRNSEGWIIAEVLGGSTGDIHQMRCNAALIASAPDLLKQRDQLAAQLEIAREALEFYAYSPEIGATFAATANNALRKLSDPAAALAEHDKRVAERCSGIVIAFIDQWHSADSGKALRQGAAEIRREFGLEAKA